MEIVENTSPECRTLLPLHVGPFDVERFGVEEHEVALGVAILAVAHRRDHDVAIGQAMHSVGTGATNCAQPRVRIGYVNVA